MGDETSDTMNLDLNLGPGPDLGSGLATSDPVNLDEWIDDPFERIREAVRVSNRARLRWRWRQVQFPPESHTLSVELNQLIANPNNRNTSLAGEGSVAAEERTNEAPKLCENNYGFLEDHMSEKKSDVEKGSESNGSFFDCNICLDLASDPVVTCCGHLFCWPCLYRWLDVHSDAKECPVCKGEVTTKTVTPIYGRGNDTRVPEDSSNDIPVRPQARRVEGWRQHLLTSLSFPMEEMIRRLGTRFDLAQDANGVIDRNAILSRYMTLRGMRTEENIAPPPDDSSSPEVRQVRRFHSLLLQRSQFERVSTRGPRSPSLNSAERLIEAYISGRNREGPQPVDDRDSISSIAAVINTESQMDTAVEIDSMGSLSTSTSRRQIDISRDVDAADSRASRRRRIN